MVEKVKRSDITEIPRDSDSLYYRLNIKNWVPLGRRIEVKEFGVQTIAFTNHFLLKHCTQVPELFIKSEEAYRFVMELKRKIGDAALINDDNVTGFEFGKYKVVFEDGEIKLFGQAGMVDHCSINSFVRKPNAQFRGLMRSMGVQG